MIFYYLKNQQVPAALRDDLLKWIYPLRKTFPDYHSYALAEWDDFFPDKETQRIEADLFESCWFENMGNGQFTIHPLPMEAQMAPIFAILSSDFNGDGKIDLLISGNTHAPDPVTGRYDAFNGLLLIGEDEQSFQPQSLQRSGFYLPGEGRDLQLVHTADGKKLILAFQNNGQLKVFEKNSTEQYQLSTLGSGH